MSLSTRPGPPLTARIKSAVAAFIAALPGPLPTLVPIAANAVRAGATLRLADAGLTALFRLFSARARAGGLVHGILLPPLLHPDSALLGSFVASYALAYDLAVVLFAPPKPARDGAAGVPVWDANDATEAWVAQRRWIGALAGAAVTAGHAYATARPTAGVFLGVRAAFVVGRAVAAAHSVAVGSWFAYAAFAAVNGPIMYAAFLEPVLLERTYYHWMLRVSAMSHTELESVVRARRTAIADGADPDALPLVDCVHGYHGGPHCFGAITADWVAGLGRALWVYVPVHLLPVLLYKRSALAGRSSRESPGDVLMAFATNVAMSAAFLSTYQAVFKGVVCASRKVLGYDASAASFAGGMATSVALVWEKPRRITELTLYCSYKSVLVAWAYAVSRGLAVPIPGAERAILTAAIAVLVTRPTAELPSLFAALRSFVLSSERGDTVPSRGKQLV